VRRVRRFVVFALTTAVATGGTLFVGMGAASAHICPIPAQIAVGQPATIQVGVTVEGATVPDVEVGIPSGLQLDGVVPKAGWTATRSGSTVRFRGGPIAAYTCEYFSLEVTAPSVGSWGITVVQRNAAGAIVANAVPDPNSSADRGLDQFVYAGVKPPSPPSSSTGLPGPVIGGIVLIGFGIVMFVTLRIRARRADDDEDEDDENEPGGGPDGGNVDVDRDAELEARLEQFRKGRPEPRSPG
jgi:hypothetical protein